MQRHTKTGCTNHNSRNRTVLEMEKGKAEVKPIAVVNSKTS